MKLMGFKRKDGSFGIRNKVLIVALDECCDGAAKNIAKQFEDTVVFTNHYTCMLAGNEEIFMQMTRVCKNPNVAAVLVISMGCGSIPVDLFIKEASCGKKIESISIIESKGSKNAIKLGIEKMKILKEYADSFKRKRFDISKLVVGVKCGGSDSISGIGANPCIGASVDKLVDLGATVIGGELIELLGCEKKLAKMAKNKEQSELIDDLIYYETKRWNVKGAETESMSIGNCVGGLTTLEEKSLGALYKMGTRNIQGVLQFNNNFIDKPNKPGFYLSEVAHLCGASAVNFLSLGAQVILWSTAGASFDNELIPAIKISASEYAYNEDMDIDARSVITGNSSYEDIASDIIDKTIKVCNGEHTNTETFSSAFLTLYQKDIRLEKMLDIKYKKCCF